MKCRGCGGSGMLEMKDDPEFVEGFCKCGRCDGTGIDADLNIEYPLLNDVLAEIKTFEYTSSESDVVVFVEDVENILSKYFR